MKKKKILFLSPYPYGTAASQRLKYEQYYDFLRDNDYEITTLSFVNNKFWKIIYKRGFVVQKMLFTIIGYLRRVKHLFLVPNFDIVYVHLWVTPLGPPVFEWLVGKLSRKMVYDIDDMIYISTGSPINRIISLIKGKNKPIRLMKEADHVITCTPDLNDFAKQYCNYCTDISSTLDTKRMQPTYDYTNTSPVVIGWTGTHSTLPYLKMLTGVLQRLAKIRKFKLMVIGNFDFHIEDVEYTYVNWTKENEVTDLQVFNIGIYPLPSDEWVMGKSGLKALQYMTFAIPAVATDVGSALHRIIIPGENGFLVKTEDEWVETLKMLIDNPEERKRVGLNARQTVEEKFSINATKKTYLSILESLIK